MIDWAKQLQDQLQDPAADGWSTANTIAKEVDRSPGTVKHWLETGVKDGTYEAKEHNGKRYYRPRKG